MFIVLAVRCTCLYFTCQFHSAGVNTRGDNDETPMTVLSTLRQRSHPSLAAFANTYATHRPLIQRILTAGFIANVLASTFRSLSTPSRPSPPSTSKGKGKAREQPPSAEAGKPPRVAVCAHLLDWLYSFDSLVPLGRRRVLSEALSDPPARNPGSPLKGGPSARHAL